VVHSEQYCLIFSLWGGGHLATLMRVIINFIIISV